MSRDFKELEDVRDVMNCLKEIREREPEIEKEIQPIQERYNLLLMYEHEVPPEEIEELHDLSASWSKLKRRAYDVSEKLRVLQVPFRLLTFFQYPLLAHISVNQALTVLAYRTKLLENVVEFIEGAIHF